MTWQQRLMVAILAAGAGAVASHRAAARVWGLPGFKQNVFEVARPARRHAKGRVGRVYEATLPIASVVIDGIPVTTVAQTLRDLGQVIPKKRLERAVDNAFAAGLVTIDELVLQLGRGRRGAGPLRAVVDERLDDFVPPAGAFSARMLELIKDEGLKVPRAEVSLGDGDGFIGRVDFYYDDERLVVEADSRRHHMSKLDFENDRKRDARFTALGIDTLRVSWRQLVRERAATADRLGRSLQARA